MPRVVFGLVPGERETPLDYVSRLAFRNGRDGIRAFCSDFRLGLRALAYGELEAVAAAAALGGADPTPLMAAALRRGPGQRTVFCGCEFHAAMVTRQRARLCPACLDADLASPRGRPASRHWRRAEWLLRDIRTCHVHLTALIDLGPEPDPRAPDFTRAVSRTIIATDAASHRSVARDPSGLELYILRRLGILRCRDTTGLPLLDALPLHACIRLAEVMGAVALDGPDATMLGIGDQRLAERQAIGFELAAREKDSVRELLDLSLSKVGHKGGQIGPQALLGRLYLWLTDPATDTSLDPVRDFVRDACLDRLAIGPGDPFSPFGTPVEIRRLHSIRSASVETGIHRTTLRNILAAASVIGPSSLPDDLVTFDAATHAELLNDLSLALDLEAAAQRLGISSTTLNELVRDGLITSFLGGNGSAFRHYRFRPRDIDAFVERLLPSEHRTDVRRTRLRSVPDAARGSSCSVSWIVRLLLDGRLTRLGRDPSTGGLASVLVDASEIHATLSENEDGLIHPKDIRQATGLPLHVVRNLVRAGLLAGGRKRHPVTGVIRLMVESDSFDRFRRENVTLVELAKAEGVSIVSMMGWLSSQRIAPSVDHRIIGAVIYRKGDLAGVVR